MNKEQLQARIVQITTEIENAKTQHTALLSHLNECNYWFSEAIKEEQELAKKVQEALDAANKSEPEPAIPELSAVDV